MLKMAKKTKAKLPNVAFGFGTKYHLTADEVMVYIHIQFAKQVGLMDSEITRTTIDMLIDDLDWWTSKESRDRSKMIKILESLEKKGYIKIESTNEKLAKGILTITIIAEMREVKVESSVSWKEKSFKFFGYTEIYGDDYNLAEKDGQKMMVISYVLWRSGVEGYKIANKEWELVLGVSDKTARDIVDNTPVVKISGAKYKDDNGQFKQETNSYVLDKNISIKNKMKKPEHSATNKSYLEKLRENVTDVNVLTDDEVFEQIFSKNKFIEFNGYKVWRETSCPIVKEQGENKFAKLRESGNEWVQEKLENEYQERLAHKRRIQEMMEQQIPSDDDIWYQEEFNPSYKRKEDTIDISS
ncbi:hypothetical protein, partial [Heyndrickxia sporothermodurans]